MKYKRREGIETRSPSQPARQADTVQTQKQADRRPCKTVHRLLVAIRPRYYSPRVRFDDCPSAPGGYGDTSWLVSSDRLREVQPLVTTDGVWPAALVGLAGNLDAVVAVRGRSLSASSRPTVSVQFPYGAALLLILRVQDGLILAEREGFEGTRTLDPAIMRAPRSTTEHN